MDIGWVLNAERLVDKQLSDTDVVTVLLKAVDTRLRDAQLIVATWSADPVQRQRIAECAQMLFDGGTQAESVQSILAELGAGVEAFESRRLLVEGDRPFDFPWHGPTSRQRILLQDDRFVELLQEPQAARSVVAAILADAGGDLSATLLAALHCKLSLAYMLTVSPNWESLPSLDGVDWDMAYSYVQHARVAPELPVRLSPPLLRARARALANVAETIRALADQCGEAGGEDLAEREAEVVALSTASFGELLARLVAAVATSGQAIALVNGPSGECADLFPMICQALCVVRHYAVASSELGSGTDALSLGAFSHALDAKHLAAGVHALGWAAFPGEVFGAFLCGMPLGGRGPDGKTLRKPVEDLLVELNAGLQALRSLLRRCECGEGNELETELIRWRLKQAVQLDIYLQSASSR